MVVCDSVDKGCPLLSPSDSTPLAKASIFYSCSLHDEKFSPAEPTSAAFPALQEMVQQEHAISGMKTPGDAGLTAVISVGSSSVTSYVLNILKKVDQVGAIIAEVSWVPNLAEAIKKHMTFLGPSIRKACLGHFKCCAKGTIDPRLFELCTDSSSDCD